MVDKYADMLEMSRPTSRKPKMSLNDRAAQFAPFAALTDYYDEIKESDRFTEEQSEIGRQADEIND